MATNHKFDPAAPGAFDGYPPLKSNPALRNSEQNHRLGEIMLTPGGVWRYVRFGEKVDPGDIVQMDERYGAPRTDGGDGHGENKDNRVYKVQDNPANGATLRQLGVVVDVGAAAGEYGWVLVDQGFAVVNARRDAAETLTTWANKAVAANDAVPAQDVLPLGCDEEAGRICPFDRAQNTLIFGIEIDEISATGAAANQKFQVRAYIRSPYAKTKTGYDAVAQPARVAPNFGNGPMFEQ